MPQKYSDFRLYSKKLTYLSGEFEIEHEKFPVRMVDKNNKVIKELKYFVYPPLNIKINGLELKKSGYNSKKAKSDKLLLDHSRFEHKPIILLEKVFVPLMRED